MPVGRFQTNVSINEPMIGSILVQARSPFHTIYIQKIIYSPNPVIVPGTILNFVDSLTGQSIGVFTIMPPSVAQPPYVIDLVLGGDATSNSGTPLSKGANLLLSLVTGGVTGRMHIKAYQLPLYVVAPYVNPQTAGLPG